MKKGLIDTVGEGFKHSYDVVSNLTDWKYVGKITLAFIPIVVFTAWYWVIKGLWLGTDDINKKGDKFLEGFLK